MERLLAQPSGPGSPDGLSFLGAAVRCSGCLRSEPQSTFTQTCTERNVGGLFWGAREHGFIHANPRRSQDSTPWGPLLFAPWTVVFLTLPGSNGPSAVPEPPLCGRDWPRAWLGGRHPAQPPPGSLGSMASSCLKNCLCSEGPEVECVHLGEVKQGEDKVLHGSIWELEENANWLLMLSPSAKSRWL